MSDDEFEQAATEREAAMTGLQPYQVRANRAVPNSLIRDIVADSRCGPTAPSSLAYARHLRSRLHQKVTAGKTQRR